MFFGSLVNVSCGHGVLSTVLVSCQHGGTTDVTAEPKKGYIHWVALYIHLVAFLYTPEV